MLLRFTQSFKENGVPEFGSFCLVPFASKLSSGNVEAVRVVLHEVEVTSDDREDVFFFFLWTHGDATAGLVPA